MNNKVGIYFAFWERNWRADYIQYIKKVKRLGFDTLEICGGDIAWKENKELRRLAAAAKEEGVELTYCIGLSPEFDVASENEDIRRKGVKYLNGILEKIAFMGGDLLGGIIYGSWPGAPGSYDAKRLSREQSLRSMKELSEPAEAMGITMCLEVVNRFEQHILNTVEEGIAYIDELGNPPGVKLLLDTFHMNIEEDSISDAIKKAGERGMLGHFHIGECNRRVPGYYGGRMPWDDIVQALSECGYEGRIVMEPFIKPGGEVGRDIKLYRDLSGGCGIEEMDIMAKEGCRFVKSLLQKY